MNTKSILFAGCVAAITLTASVAMAEGHGFAGGGSSGGGARGGGFHGGGGGFHGSMAPGGMRPGFARAGSRFGAGGFRNFRGDRDFHHHHRFNDRFVFFGGFGYPFFYDPFFYGYYPYGYGYGGYGYGAYGYGNGGYGYGYDPYDQPGYGGVAVGSGSSVREIQRRLARAGYYHGPIDGVMCPQTRYAMRAYQRAHNMRVTER